jgi:hypothetical protein
MAADEQRLREQNNFAGSPQLAAHCWRTAERWVMPIRGEFRALYPPHWGELSRLVRFERAGGTCQRCGRPHGMELRCLPDGRWFDPDLRTWRDRRGRPARWPDLEEMTHQYTTRVILAAAHLDHDPTNNRLRNLRSLCQRCHLIQDRSYHLLQRWITYRLRYAGGDLFLGAYRHGQAATRLLSEILVRIASQVSAERGSTGRLDWPGCPPLRGPPPQPDLGF